MCSTCLKDLSHVVIISYALAEWDTEPAVKYLVAKAAQRQWPVRPDGEVARVVQDAFALAFDANPAHVLALCDTAAPSDEEAMRTALHYVEQWRVARWSAQLNREKGVEPSSEDCFIEHARRLEAHPEHVRPRSLASGKPGAMRMGGTRWRQLWSGSYAALPSREVIPLAGIRQKAGHITGETSPLLFSG